jgi:hypothetical protein
MARRVWESLSDNYRNRLSRNGITREAYERGDSLKAARGHKPGVTPEHPSDIKTSPKDYERYRKDRAARIGGERQRSGISGNEQDELIERALRNAVRILESEDKNFSRETIRANLRQLNVDELRKAATINADTWHKFARSGKSAGAYWYGKKSRKS